MKRKTCEKTKYDGCKYEKEKDECVAKSTCEMQTKKRKCKQAGDCTWEGRNKGSVLLVCVDAEK